MLGARAMIAPIKMRQIIEKRGHKYRNSTKIMGPNFRNPTQIQIKIVILPKWSSKDRVGSQKEWSKR